MNILPTPSEPSLSLTEEQKQELFRLRQALVQIDQEQVKIMQELNQRRGVYTAQIDELLELNFNLERSLQRFLQKRTQFGLRNDGAPTPEQLQNWLTPERKQAIQLLQQPVTLWIPAHETFEQRVAAINNSKLSPRKTYVNSEVFRLSESTTTVTSGHLAIVDGAQEVELLEVDDVSKTFGERINLIQTYRKSRNLTGFDRDLSSALYIHSLSLGKPTDARHYTVLDEDVACNDTFVPLSDWSDDRVKFCRYHVSYRRDGARFRSAVRGDIDA